MTLEKQIEETVSVSDPSEHSHLNIRRCVVIFEDGVEIARGLPHRHIKYPGDDIKNESAEVKRYASFFHTENVIAEYRQARKQSGVKRDGEQSPLRM